MNRLRVGIIGLGVGWQHIAGYEAHPACQVTALCDLSEEKLARARREYPSVKLTPHAADLLEDPDLDVVSIATYDDCHYEQTAQALRNGQHVFVEKPVCQSENQARELRELLLSRPQLVLSSNLILRRCPRFRWLKGQLVEGRLGRLFYMEGDYNYGRLHKITEGWRGRIDNYSVVHGGAIHMVDLLAWLCREWPISVSACGNRIASEGSGFRYNDLVVALLEFESGLVGKVAVNFGCVLPHFHNLSVYGTAGTFVNSRDAGLLFESREADAEPQLIDEPYPGAHKGELVSNFIESIISGAPAEVTADDVFRTMSVCLAIEQATGCDRTVAVRYV